MSNSSEIHVQVLGPVRLSDATTSLGPKQRLLLGALAICPDGLSSDAMIDLLWGQDVPDNPRAALQVHVSKLRRPLADIGASVLFQNDGYSLGVDRRHVDVTCFEQLFHEGSAALSTDPRQARDLLSAALDLWRGSPLGGLAEDTFLRGDVQRLEDTRVSALEARIEADLALGGHAEVVAELRHLTRTHPLHEGFWRQYLLALYRAGRAGEALAAFEEARAHIADELGADPAPELQELHRRILQQDPSLAEAAGPATTRPVSVTTTSQSAASVAVLPFEVLGTSDDAALLATGLHIDLLTELSRIDELTVISRQSVLQYDASGRQLEQIAKELGVSLVVLGSIRTAGQRFRLSVQLIDATAGSHRWAESYDHELNTHSLLAVQRDLASDIAAALSRKLSPSAAPTTASMEAYRLVVEGRMHFDRKTEDGLAAAVERFRRAVVVDPGYGLAWVGLANALAMTADYGYGDRQELLEAAESAVVRALAMVPDTADVHESLGLIAEGRFDGPGARAEYEKAIRISPSHADAHSWHAWTSLTLGDAARALVSARRAVELNPLSAEAVSNLGLSLLAVGEPENALAEARRSDTLSPGYTTAAYYEGLALYDLGRFEESVAVLTPLAFAGAAQLTVPWAGMAPDAALALAQVAAGDLEGARATLASIDADAHPVEAGLVHAGLGDMTAAYERFAGKAHVGYGGAMLYHLHFRDVWARLDDQARLDDLARHIARSWKAEPRFLSRGTES